ncbi:MAG: hypothetical protein ACT6T2_25885 [Shinella sp.]
MSRALQRMAGTVVGALLAWVPLMQGTFGMAHDFRSGDCPSPDGDGDRH